MRFLVGFVIMVAGPAFGGNGALCVTIDDRNLKNWEQTIPVFEKYGAHTTFFVCGEIDTDAERCLRRPDHQRCRLLGEGRVFEQNEGRNQL